jgi:hypothetical protein
MNSSNESQSGPLILPPKYQFIGREPIPLSVRANLIYTLKNQELLELLGLIEEIQLRNKDRLIDLISRILHDEGCPSKSMKNGLSSQPKRWKFSIKFSSTKMTR